MALRAPSEENENGGEQRVEARDLRDLSKASRATSKDDGLPGGSPMIMFMMLMINDHGLDPEP